MPDSQLRIVLEARDEASRVLGNVNKQLGELERTGRTASAQMRDMGRGVSQAGRDLLPVSLALGGIGIAALKTAADYESSMNVLQAVSGATGEEMKRLGELAVALGADMSLPATSAVDAGKAMTELAKAGLSVNDILGATKGVLQLAAAGQLSEADAAETTANALNAFKLRGEEAVRVADLLAAAANTSSAEVDDMAFALRMAATVFASANIPIEDLITALGLMANAGIKNSDAGTSMKQMLLRLQSPAKEAAGLMKDLGISIYDAKGKMKSMEDIIRVFSSSMKSLTQQQRDNALAAIFGSDAVRAANVVLLGGVEAFGEMKRSVTEEGAAATLAAAKTKGLAGAFEALKSQMETVLLTAGTPLLNVLESLTRGIADLIGKFGGLPPELQTVIVIISLVVGVAAPLLIILGQLMIALSALAPVIGAVGAAIGLLLSPIGAVIAIIALLVLAWTQNWGDIQGITRAAADGLGSILGWLGDRFGDFIKFVGDSIGTLTAPFQWLGDRLGDLGRMVEGLLNGLRQVPGVAGAFELAGGLMGFQEGGMVPGPFGAPRLAMVHGGEAVLTPQQQGGWGGLTINGPLIGSAVIREDADIERLAQAIDQKLAKRALGTPQGWRR